MMRIRLQNVMLGLKEVQGCEFSIIITCMSVIGHLGSTWPIPSPGNVVNLLVKSVLHSSVTTFIGLGKFRFIFWPIPFYLFALSILSQKFCTIFLQFNSAGKILQIFSRNSILSQKFAKKFPNSANLPFF